MFNRRFFGFGCSYTKYEYPTWADIIGSNFKEYFNFGQAGCSNFYIFTAITEAHKKFKFTKNDLVIVEWTDEFRKDMFNNQNWCLQLHRDRDYSSNYLDLYGLYLETMTYMSSVQEWLDSIGIEYYFIRMNLLSHTSKIPTSHSHKLKHYELDKPYPLNIPLPFVAPENFYKTTIDKLYPAIDEFLGEGCKNRPIYFRKLKIEDGHPMPWQYYDYVKHFFPQFMLNDFNLRNHLMDVFEIYLRQKIQLKQEFEPNTINWPVGISILDQKYALTTLYNLIEKND